MSNQSSSLPAAIVIAGALVGAGLFFGLRARAPEAVPAPPISSTPPAPVTPGAAPQPTPAPAQADEKKVARDAIAALEAQRATLAQACWEPSARAKPSPAYIDYVVDVTFDATGNQITRAFSEERRTARADVTACISAKIAPLKVPPPGANVRVEIPFRLP